AGCVMIWSALFAVGKYLYGQWKWSVALAAIFVVSGWMVLYVMNLLWSDKSSGTNGSGDADRSADAAEAVSSM
ncbi:MAG: hypothetical protein FWC56_05865, partial [Phycisphaerae bacterium]|nr:hypothetical protein [Phycisphaerae bacterium]